MYIRLIQPFVVLAAMLFCGMAHAHPGHGSGYLAGITHPLVGLDHLLAMLAVGVWASQLGGRAMWIVPASFVTLMGLAAGLGMSGVVLPMVEVGITTSLLLLGLLVAFSIKLSPIFSVAIVGLFAVFHGFAHGMELPAVGAPWQYSLGFVVSTVALHGIGLLLGQRLRGRQLWLRAAGWAVAASGASLMMTI